MSKSSGEISSQIWSYLYIVPF